MSMLPFKFGVMFGDIGHGMLLFLAGIFLCRKHATLKPNTQIYNHIVFKARYIVVLLGFFALYSGFIYNNLFSLPIGLFAGSCYKTIEVNYKKQFQKWFKISGNLVIFWKDPEGNQISFKKPQCTYPFGLDPKWYIASNELNFFNSYKMKLAIIIGK